MIGGYTAGNPFDALIVGCYEGSKLKFVSKVRNGFVPHMRCALSPLLQQLRTEKCPFVNLPEKRCGPWAINLTKRPNGELPVGEPELVAQIEFTEWTPDGHLRHASFAGMRGDKSRGALCVNNHSSVRVR
ncbi:MAG TPA: hypothetical protein VFP47_11120 [Pyrinomonadaceae bacterium]|nr:hypothetical protein [Pyrinomonadaceae bacterium]